MKLKSPLLIRLGGLLGATTIRLWSSTLDHKVAYYDPAVDPASELCRSPKIYILWHEYLLSLLPLRGRCNAALLISQHRDGEILSRVTFHLGYEMVRGSTRRGGVTALRRVLGDRRGLHLAVTPDGPRGPRRHLSPGAVYLASRLGMPLVPVGLGFERPWRLPSWDRFAIPRPFSRSRVVWGPDIFVPEDLDRDGLEDFRQRVEQLLDRLTAEAESWAESGTRRAGQMDLAACPCRVRLAPPRFHGRRGRRPADFQCPGSPAVAPTGQCGPGSDTAETAAGVVMRAC